MGPTGRSLFRAAVLGLAVLAVTACELRTELAVTVDDDGSGTVDFAVGLDDETATLRPDLLGDLDVDHLVDAGWDVTGPTLEEGFQWIRARHRFDRPGEVGPLIDQIAGEQGPFRDFEVTRSSGATSERFRFRGTVDFSGGLGDSPVADDLAAASDADVPAADVIAELGDRFGAAVDEIVGVTVAVRLPGDVESNAATRASNGAVWRPSVTERGALDLEATGTRSRTGSLVLIGVGVVIAVGLVLAGAVRLAVWRRRDG